MAKLRLLKNIIMGAPKVVGSIGRPMARGLSAIMPKTKTEFATTVLPDLFFATVEQGHLPDTANPLERGLTFLSSAGLSTVAGLGTGAMARRVPGLGKNQAFTTIADMTGSYLGDMGAQYGIDAISSGLHPSGLNYWERMNKKQQEEYKQQILASAGLLPGIREPDMYINPYLG